ncbi:hypothetical protein KC316_g18579 [Hortaea werneckii]|nr:hypothetical protein KC334_g18117 [Hortaea werneckii]KAI7131141.1 hypothetical protein KC324_g17022 [Hortaea werneckii]KAI7524854.1 hypothetical protein KC316_g18579 [Hortaea werneckii]RMX90903.1 hypothetical protein D0867_15177 [Hortaea werneckii]
MQRTSSPVDFSRIIDFRTVKDKTAVVTGGASGVGNGVVRALAQNGAVVGIADINEEDGEKSADKFRRGGLPVYCHRTDVTDWQSQLAAFKTAIQLSPNRTLDIVVSCAGLTGPSFFHEPTFHQTSESGDPPPPSTRLLDVNLTGAMYTTSLAMHYFRQAVPPSPADKVLILVGSNVAYNAIPLYSMYAASKMGVRGLFKTLRHHPDESGCRINMIAPHIIRSPMTAALQPMMDERGLGMVEVEDCADAAIRMICDKQIRGRCLFVHPGGDTFDAMDDEEGLDGAKAFYEHKTRDIEKQTEFMIELLEQ